MRTIFSVLTSIFIYFAAGAQGSLTGSWYGKAEAVLSGSHNSYLTELIIKQKGDEVTGVFGYYFRDGYKSVFVRGNYNVKTRKLVIENIPMTYFRASSIDGVDCPMDLYGTLLISKVSSTLQGSLLTTDKYKYTCPELSLNYILDNSEYNMQDSLIQNSTTRKLWQPQPEDLIVVNTPSIVPATTEPSTDSSQRISLPAAIAFEKRDAIIAEQITVNSDSLRISFYDNGDIDGDSISVFLNNIPVLTRRELTAEAINIYLKLDSTVAVNEITMYAENLGKYPPNTALMVVNDGVKRHEIYLSSSLNKNATVRIRRTRKSE